MPADSCNMLLVLQCSWHEHLYENLRAQCKTCCAFAVTYLLQAALHNVYAVLHPTASKLDKQ